MPIVRTAMFVALMGAPAIFAAERFGTGLPQVTSISSAGSSAGDFRVRIWTVHDGLPQNTIESLAQDSAGSLWVGTHFGLARFDGRHFTRYDRDNTPALAASEVCTALAADPADGSLWIGTLDGLLHKQGTAWTRFTTTNGLPYNNVLALCPLRDGGLWIGAGRELVRHRHGEFSSHPTRPGNPWVFERLTAIFEDRDGTVYAGDSFGLHRFDPSDGRFKLIYNTVEGGAWGNPVEGILRDRTGDLWFGTWNGARRLRADGVQRFIDTEGLAVRRIGAMVQDRAGTLWATTYGGGVFWFDDGRWRPAPFNDQFASLSCGPMLEDREGNLWIGTRNGGLIQLMPRRVTACTTRDGLVYDNVWSISGAPDGRVWLAGGGGVGRWRRGEVTNFTRTNQLVFHLPHSLDAAVGTVFADRTGRVWIGARTLFMCYEDGRWHDRYVWGGVTNSGVQCLYEDRAGNLWFGSEHHLHCLSGNRVAVFTKADGLPSQEIRAIHEDAAGRLWLGTHGGGLVEFTVPREAGPTTSGDARPKVRVLTTRDGLSNNRVWAIHEDADGALWLGTESGLNRFKDGRFFVFTREHGLFDNLVNHLEEDDTGHFWISCNRGISRVSRHELNAVAAGRTNRVQCLVLGEQDGMPNGETNGERQPAGCTARDGRIWFPTQGGAAVIDPRAFRFNTNPPPVLIEQVVADGVAVFGEGTTNSPGVPGEVHLAPGRARTLIIHYTANCFTSPDKVRFRYRLEGHDDDWQEDNANLRTAIYTNLRPGQYRFRVRALNGDGVLSEGDAGFAFTLAPFFHETWPFYVLCAFVVMAAGGAAHFSRMRGLRRIKELEQRHALELERTRIARDMHDSLGADLTRIALLADTAQRVPADVQSGRTQLERVSALARNLVDGISELVWATNPRHNTLDSLAAYLHEHAADSLEPTGIRFRFEAPRSLPALPISGEMRRHLFLAAKEALHNAVKHAQATEIKLRFAVVDHLLEITVADNGQGFMVSAQDSPGHHANLSARHGNGLHNLRERMAGIGGELRIDSSPGHGTQVRLQVALP